MTRLCAAPLLFARLAAGLSFAIREAPGPRTSGLPSAVLHAEDASGIDVGSCSVTALRIGADGFLDSRALAIPLLSGLYVQPQHRRQGIAGALVQAAERAALDWGFCELRLQVHECNLPALRLYRNLGYQVDEEQEVRWTDLSLSWDTWPPQMGRRLDLWKGLGHARRTADV